MSENLLKYETSPYLLQHKENPVHWRPWGAEAFEEARRQDKPVLLSVGYSACHWCHVMAHESFEDPQIAGLMNELFINIKVDREERPDVDQIYMAGLQALGGRGGWPLTVFLTPRGDLFWGGTYFSPTPRFGRAGFPDILKQVEKAYRDEPERVAENAARAAKSNSDKSSAAIPSESESLSLAFLDSVAKSLVDKLDPDNGGISGAPKFPQAALFEFLWRTADRTGDPAFEQAFLLTMTKICRGGIYDCLGGGFARYSVDAGWRVPHFEKMLYDNAQILKLSCWAWKATRDPLYARSIEQTVEWLRRDMRVEGGAFASSLDADSEGVEGKFYVWTLSELEAALGPRDAALAAAHYGATPAGNWEGVNVLNTLDEASVDESAFESIRQKLFETRSRRSAPNRDDKVLADWNGLTIEALCIAAATFEREDWLDLARDAHAFVIRAMVRDDRIGHSARLGRVTRPGLSSDAACMVAAALALFEVTGDQRYLGDAKRWQASFEAFHFDADRGFLLTASDVLDLAERPWGALDEATPNPNAVAVSNLIRLSSLTGDSARLQKADRVMQIFSASAQREPFRHLGLLNAFDFASRTVEAVVVGPRKASKKLVREIVQSKRPNVIFLQSADPATAPVGSPAHGRPMVGSAPTAYVCREGTCSLPIVDSEALGRALSR